MNNKKIEKFIKDNIKLDFNDISNELSNYKFDEKKPKSYIYKYCAVFGVAIVLFISTLVFINLNSETNNFSDENKKDILVANNGEYNNYYNSVALEIDKSEYDYEASYEELNKKFSLSLNKKNILSIKCNNENDSNQCNIVYIYKDKKIYINVQNGSIPKFTSEIEENWNTNLANNQIRYSTINNRTFAIINNTNRETYISEYYNNTNVSNFRTKFKYNSIGYSLESYEHSLNEFGSCIKEIINGTL